MRILFAIALLTLACVTSGCTFFTRGDDHAASDTPAVGSPSGEVPPAAPSEEGEAPR
jgi:hypothetical protein